MTSSLPREGQLEALQQMREMTGMPDDAYAPLVREVEAGGCTAQIVMRALEQRRSALDPKTIEYNVYKLYS